MPENVLTFFNNIKWYYFIPILIIIIIIIGIFINTNNSQNDYVDEPIITSREEITTKFKIDVKGEVKNPGVYEVDDGMIVLDAINLAGGLTAKADTSNINLSEKLYESMVIIIENKNANIYSQSNKISINNGSKEELMTLTGIGESKALAIIDYRKKQKFTKIEDIMLVNGIGESTFAKIKNNITI